MRVLREMAAFCVALSSTLRSGVKRLLVTLLYGSGVLSMARWLNRHRLLILTYHGVIPGREMADPYLSRNFVDEREFHAQMTQLARRYRCMRLSEAVELLASGRRMPPYSVVVTFDDGFANNFRYAFPVLRRHRIPAAIFLATGHVGQGMSPLWTERVALAIAGAPRREVVMQTGNGSVRLQVGSRSDRARAAQYALRVLKAAPLEQRERMIIELERQTRTGSAEPDAETDTYEFLEWNEVREMAAWGIEFGSHTVRHPILSGLDDAARAKEIVESKEEIERQLGIPCTLFSYPNGRQGDFGEEDKRTLRRTGYVAAVTQIAGFNKGGDDLFELRRLNIGRGHSGVMFRAQVSGVWPLLRRIWQGGAHR